MPIVALLPPSPGVLILVAISSLQLLTSLVQNAVPGAGFHGSDILGEQKPPPTPLIVNPNPP
jgi:hypothetical protein